MNHFMSVVNYKAPQKLLITCHCVYSDQQNKYMRTLNKLLESMKLAILDFPKKSGVLVHSDV